MTRRGSAALQLVIMLSCLLLAGRAWGMAQRLNIFNLPATKALPSIASLEAPKQNYPNNIAAIRNIFFYEDGNEMQETTTHAAEAAPNNTTSSAKSMFVLKGTTVLSDSNAFALISIEHAPVHSFHIGEVLKDWKLIRVERGKAWLKRAEVTEMIEIGGAQ